MASLENENGKSRKKMVARKGVLNTNQLRITGMSEFINGISYVFYHNSYLKYYLFLIILIRIQRNSIDISLSSFASN